MVLTVDGVKRELTIRQVKVNMPNGRMATRLEGHSDGMYCAGRTIRNVVDNYCDYLRRGKY